MPPKNLRKRAASGSLKDALPSGNTFTPINKGKTAVASGSSTKRQRAEDDNEDTEGEPSQDGSPSARYDKTLYTGRKNTQMKSKARAEVNEEMPRPETCLRCAGEYALFPELKCTLAPNSVAGKCMDCVKKGKSCEDVPAVLMGVLSQLQDVALKVVIGESSGEALKIAQARFDAEKKRANHTSKVGDAAAVKSPWKPVVDSNAELSSSITSAIAEASGHALRSAAKVTAAIDVTNAALLEGIRGLRMDFRTVHAGFFPQVASPDAQPEVDREEVPDGDVDAADQEVAE